MAYETNGQVFYQFSESIRKRNVLSIDSVNDVKVGERVCVCVNVDDGTSSRTFFLDALVFGTGTHREREKKMRITSTGASSRETLYVKKNVIYVQYIVGENPSLVRDKLKKLFIPEFAEPSMVFKIVDGLFTLPGHCLTTKPLLKKLLYLLDQLEPSSQIEVLKRDRFVNSSSTTGCIPFAKQIKEY